ncbi:thiol reductant ABC exporter subunit CydD [Glycomyces sp. TRM65418]|uniref:thiol reductant ABC exporter subunit CydD n=1 Tax=Glycomyces sp. TRM65418 TaxID=2867006 RepID=UPI001CE5CABD|nr:thiol reductant ABC exporter subunit CydD [Glycomyces sp. TRM65418]MCC3765442.1 thiol reductant ABC exporter subunit CydD [Glycomyces sp. TRM65418]QZD55052.1 thiol reductant ABC exporter subunit CydD [Glycomyces sp. TRM65418]
MTPLAARSRGGAVDRRLLHQAHGATAFIGVCVALGLARTACVAAGAWLIASLIAGAFAAGRDLASLTPQLIALAAVLASRALLASVQGAAAHRAGAGVKSALRRRALEHLMRLPSDGRHSGATAALLVRGIDALDGYFARYLPQLVLAVVVPMGVVAVMLAAYPPAALIVILTLPLIPLFGILIGRYTRSRAERQWESTAHLAHHFADLVAGLPTLKAFGRAARQEGAIEATTGAYRRRSMELLRIAFCSALVLELAASLSVAIVAVTVGVDLVEGGMPGEAGLRTALFVLILAPEAYLPLRAAGAHYHASAEGLAAAEQVFAILDEPPEEATRGAEPAQRGMTDAEPSARETHGGGGAMSLPLKGLSMGITFRRVVFAYPGREPLPEWSLTVPAGQTTVLTARSGAGKSTLMAALVGFRRPVSGSIAFDGTDLADLDPAAVRRSIAWLPQRPVLIDGTVADNVRLAVPEGARDAAVAKAIAAAHAPAATRRVAADGSGLSAGEAARVGLARLLLRVDLLDPPILLLDEPTAHLDADTEQAVLHAFAPYRQDRTVLIASHRPAVRAIADREADR